MLERYALPRAFETEELAARLAGLTPKQRRVLREYVDRVELGQLNVTAWLADEKCPVREGTWYAAGERAAYRNSEQFQETLAAYLRLALKAQAAEEVKGITSAKRILRLGATKAAERLVDLVDKAERDIDKIRASEAVLDRADLETASKSETTMELGTRFEEALQRAYGSEGAGDAPTG